MTSLFTTRSAHGRCRYSFAGKLALRRYIVFFRGTLALQFQPTATDRRPNQISRGEGTGSSKNNLRGLSTGRLPAPLDSGRDDLQSPVTALVNFRHYIPSGPSSSTSGRRARRGPKYVPTRFARRDCYLFAPWPVRTTVTDSDDVVAVSIRNRLHRSQSQART